MQGGRNRGWKRGGQGGEGRERENSLREDNGSDEKYRFYRWKK
jgi:hypothetical protein